MMGGIWPLLKWPKYHFLANSSHHLCKLGHFGTPFLDPRPQNYINDGRNWPKTEKTWNLTMILCSVHKCRLSYPEWVKIRHFGPKWPKWPIWGIMGHTWSNTLWSLTQISINLPLYTHICHFGHFGQNDPFYVIFCLCLSLTNHG